MPNIIQPWTDGYWVAFTEHNPTFSNIPKFGIAGFFEDVNVWIHEFTEMAIHDWMKREYYYISHRASHILTSLAVSSAIRIRKTLHIVGPDEYYRRITIGKQKRLTAWWMPDDRTSLQDPQSQLSEKLVGSQSDSATNSKEEGR